MRARLVRLFLVAIAPFLLLELALRLVGPLVPSIEPLLYDPKIVHRYDEVRTLEELLDLSVLGFHPNTRFLDFILNSRSFHTREYTEKKPPGTLRILGIGDSFTFAAGVPYAEGWPARLQAQLQQQTDVRVEVVNLGVPAAAPEFELRLWELEGAKLQADLVVVAFHVGSDFYDSSRVRRDRTWADRFALWSYSFRFVRNVIRLKASRPAGRGRHREPDSLAVPEGAGGDPALVHVRPLISPLAVPEGAGGVPVAEVVRGFNYRYDPQRANMSEDAFAGLEASHLRVCYGIDMDAMFDSAAQTLIRFRQEVVAGGAEFVVMVCPVELQTSPEFLRRALESGQPSPGPIGDRLDLPQEFLKDVFEREGIRHLDLLPAFREAAAHKVLYGLLDSHWNPEGNAVAADTLLDYLARPPESGEPWPWQHLLRFVPDRRPDAADTRRDR